MKNGLLHPHHFNQTVIFIEQPKRHNTLLYPRNNNHGFHQRNGSLVVRNQTKTFRPHHQSNGHLSQTQTTSVHFRFPVDSLLLKERPKSILIIPHEQNHRLSHVAHHSENNGVVEKLDTTDSNTVSSELNFSEQDDVALSENPKEDLQEREDNNDKGAVLRPNVQDLFRSSIHSSHVTSLTSLRKQNNCNVIPMTSVPRSQTDNTLYCCQENTIPVSHDDASLPISAPLLFGINDQKSKNKKFSTKSEDDPKICSTENKNM
jgi:hypothetical protein